MWVGGVLVQMSCYPTWVSTLCQRSSPFRCFSFGVLHPCRERQLVCLQLLVYSWGCVGGFFAAPLGFLPCAMLFIRACSVRCFPCYRFPWGFQVTGCLSFCFPGDVGWASALPFFSGLLLLRLLAGVVGVLHPVSGCSCCGDVCLVCR